MLTKDEVKAESARNLEMRIAEWHKQFVEDIKESITGQPYATDMMTVARQIESLLRDVNALLGYCEILAYKVAQLEETGGEQL